MSLKKARPLWVGEFADGEIVVFDPENQVFTEPDTVYLWSQQTERSEGYHKDVVKKLISKVGDKVKSDLAIAKYVVLRDARRKMFDEQRRANEESIELRHQAMLQALGKEYLGVRQAPPEGPKFVRVTREPLHR